MTRPRPRCCRFNAWTSSRCGILPRYLGCGPCQHRVNGGRVLLILSVSVLAFAPPLLVLDRTGFCPALVCGFALGHLPACIVLGHHSTALHIPTTRVVSGLGISIGHVSVSILARPHVAELVPEAGMQCREQTDDGRKSAEYACPQACTLNVLGSGPDAVSATVAVLQDCVSMGVRGGGGSKSYGWQAV